MVTGLWTGIDISGEGFWTWGRTGTDTGEIMCFGVILLIAEITLRLLKTQPPSVQSVIGAKVYRHAVNIQLCFLRGI